MPNTTRSAVLLLAACLSALLPQARAAAQLPTPPGRTLLAVFAHPDDETMVGPLLSLYARQPGTRVHIVIVTNGDQGVTPFAGIQAGAPLAAARAKEMACAAAALGAQAPVLLGLPDGGLGSAKVLGEAAAGLRKTIAELRPDAIVTWGPDGGSGHPDHRLVSALVTQIVQTGETTRRLYYPGLPASRMDEKALAALKFSAPFAPTLDEFLHVRVPYAADDAVRARAALACHVSQFTPQAMQMISMLTEKVHAGAMHLRSWTGGEAKTDLFE